VDIYIKDYEATRKLAQKFPVKDIPALSRRSMSVVKEHIKLIRQYEPDLVLYSAADNSTPKSSSPSASPVKALQIEGVPHLLFASAASEQAGAH